MVYCTKCGFKNEDDAKVCAQCGAPLQISRTERRHRSDDECFGLRERDWEDECFGFRERDWEDKCFRLPHAGSLLGLIFGIAIVIIGLAIIFEKSIWSLLGSFLVIVFGFLIIIGILFGRRSRY